MQHTRIHVVLIECDHIVAVGMVFSHLAPATRIASVDDATIRILRQLQRVRERHARLQNDVARTPTTIRPLTIRIQIHHTAPPTPNTQSHPRDCPSSACATPAPSSTAPSCSPHPAPTTHAPDT